jgi:hypothetical protein
MLKTFIIFLLFPLYLLNGYSQVEIDTSNYYNYLDTKKSISWLDREEVVLIIIEELKKRSGVEYDTYVLFKLDSSQYVVLSAYSPDLDLGFLYCRIHEYPPQKEHRLLRSQDYNDTGYDYIQKLRSGNKTTSFIKIKNIPNNIILLNEDCYWYQDTVQTKKTVTKNVISMILKQDINKYIDRAISTKKK